MKDAMTSRDTHPLIHELELHRLGLGLQNEELRQASVEHEVNYDERYESDPIGYFTLGRYLSYPCHSGR